jgi:hypothetical protein
MKHFSDVTILKKLFQTSGCEKTLIDSGSKEVNTVVACFDLNEPQGWRCCSLKIWMVKGRGWPTLKLCFLWQTTFKAWWIKDLLLGEGRRTIGWQIERSKISKLRFFQIHICVLWTQVQKAQKGKIICFALFSNFWAFLILRQDSQIWFLKLDFRHFFNSRNFLSYKSYSSKIWKYQKT